MRTLAVSLLLFAAAVYVATLGRDGFLGFVNAGAEASMVGAIADWFAVTALFKHPLGMPVPHTALIPKRKDELGKGLEEFVGENFLQEEIIRERVAAAGSRCASGLARRTGARPAGRRRDRRRRRLALNRVRDEHIEGLIRDALVPRFREEPIAPLLGSLLEEAVRDDLHHGLVDLGLVELHRWLVENPDTVAEILGERAPWWAPTRLNEAVTGRCTPSGAVGRGHPRRPAAPRAAGAGLDARPARRRPAARRRHPGARRARQGAAARPPAGDRVERLALERAPAPLRPRCTTRAAPYACGC